VRRLIPHTFSALLAATALVVSPLAGPAVGAPSAAAADCEPTTVTVAGTDFSSGALPAELRQSGGGTGTLTFADGAMAVNGRNADYVGIETVPGLLEPGVSYTASASIRLADGTPATQARWVGFPGYSWIGNAAVTADAWTTITGTWVAPASDDPAATRLYIGTSDLPDAAAYTYLVDDVVITTQVDDCEGPVQEPGTVLIDEDFEDGALGDWFARQGSDTAGVTVGVVEGGADGTTFAAQVSDRVHEGDGIQIDVRDVLLPGRTYELEAFVRFAPGAETGQGLTVSMRTVTGSSISYGNLFQIEDATATGWTKVAGQFTVPGYDTNAELYVEARYNSGNTSTFLVDQVTVRVPEPEVIDTSLVPIKDTVDFPVGVAIDERETTGAASDLLLHHFDQVTPENHMKVESWYDADGQFARHSQATALLDFAQQNDLRVYGHVLLWHSQTPAWFFQDADGRELTASEADKQILRDRLAAHIDAVARSIHDDYGDYGSPTNPVVGWDVVNEVIADQETPDGLRTSRWHDVLGEEYIHLAFELADQAFNETYAAADADRPVKLFINDYNTEQDRKGDQYEALVKRMLAAGTPLDGVGHQFHLSITSTIASLEAALDRFAGLGLLQEVTELDVTINPADEPNRVRQGHFYRDAFALFREYDAGAPASEKLFAVTVWGLTDTRSWRAAQQPLLFTGDLQAKPAYYGAVGDEDDLPPLITTANVFEGDVALDDGFADAVEWLNLPEQALTGGIGGFQTRWNADHLTVLVRTTVDYERIEFTYDGAELVYEPGAAGSPAGATTSVDGIRYTVVHLPHTDAAAGASKEFDVRVVAGGAVAGAWNTPGAIGRLTLLEPLSYLEVPEAAAPTIDGAVDATWAQAAVATTANLVEGNAAGATADVRTVWQGNTLYALFEVTDPEIDTTNSDPWNQDSVELFLDLGNSKAGAYGPNDTQIRITVDNALSFGTGNAAQQEARVIGSATARTGTGYVVEAAIELIGQSGGQSDVPLGGAGTFHGIDFQVNDGRAGARYAVHTWAEPTGTGYQSTARWGVARLVEPTAPPVDTRVDSVVLGVPHTLIATQKSKVKYTVIVLATKRPTGTVTVYDGTTPVATATLEAKHRGTLTVQLPRLDRGVHRLWAEYAGSDLVRGSTSPKVPLLIL
jgi:endo-1,4-beta-xylanase